MRGDCDLVLQTTFFMIATLILVMNVLIMLNKDDVKDVNWSKLGFDLRREDIKKLKPIKILF